MCIICASPKGRPQPTTEQIQAMFAKNPHGAGYMYTRNHQVVIHKGFMNISELVDQLRHEHFTADDPVVYHFRISTQAGVTPAMTQPFPLTTRLELTEKLNLVCPCGVAHNGIIRMTSTGNKRYSDTALFVSAYMSQIVRNHKDILNPAILDILGELTNSKLAILDNTGHIATVGNFIDDGCLFSNASYESTVQFVNSPFADDFDEDLDVDLLDYLQRRV